MNYILASASPRRRDILQNLGLAFTVITADTDESCEQTDACALVEQLAERKGIAVQNALAAQGTPMSDTVILSADTVVVCDGQILGKPHDRDDARRMLQLLQNRSHEVISGVALTYRGKTYTDHSVTSVSFDCLDAEELERYLDTDEPYDKAGAYGIQGHASLWVREIRGSYFGVVGLPVHVLNRLHRRVLGKPLV